MERDRILLWEACRNVRDLGGYRTPAGRTRWGALVRADSLGQLTPAGQSSLIAYGIRTVIDVRFPEEAPVTQIRSRISPVERTPRRTSTSR